MPPTPSDRADVIFGEALDLSPAEREAHVVAACEDDTALMAEVQALLAAHEATPTEFLESPAAAADEVTDANLDATLAADGSGKTSGKPAGAVDDSGSDSSGDVNPMSLLRAFKDGKPGASLPESLTEKEGDEVGPYKLLQQIGEGGFGTVWMAEQSEPISRKVALKVIKAGMDTKEVLARFEVERQALALMDDPNIAKVLDAGATESGRPWFAMELVKGIPITQFCDQQKLGTRERLELFGDVCSAINHAHQKGVIHRGIKPSNVMVTLHGDKPVVKVIDFGIAKATQSKLTDKTLFTAFEQMLGTPIYMSPEQASLSGLDIDTRSDIYGLGVLLYELLTGRPPFDAKSLVSAGYEEMRRIIREEEPPRPSLRLSTVSGKDETTRITSTHGKEPQKLSRIVKGELDWIVMKAIEKDRSRRYETANAFAADIGRYLNDEPVQAAAPSAAYKFKKFARRNKATIGTAALIASVLVAATGVSTWQAVRATKAEGLALSEKRRAEDAEELALTRLNQVQYEKRRADELRQDAMVQRDSAIMARKALEDSEKAAKGAEEKAKEITTVTAGWLNNLLVKAEGPDRLATLSEIENDLPTLYNALMPQGELGVSFTELASAVEAGTLDVKAIDAFDDHARYAQAFALDQTKKDEIAIYRMWVKIWKAEEFFRVMDFRTMIEELDQLRPSEIDDALAGDLREIQRRKEVLMARLAPKIKLVEASSSLSSQGENNYLSENLIDGKPETAWVSDHDDEIRWVRISFENPAIVRSINIAPGYAKSDKSFSENGSVKNISFEFSNGSAKTFKFPRENTLQSCKLETPVVTNWVKIRILSFYPGNREEWSNDVPVSMIEFK